MPIIGRLTDVEKEKLEWIRQKILQDLSVHYTIEWLSKKSGLNEFTLKKGFKKQYGTTVFGYLEDHRLQLGQQLVTSSYEPLQAIAFKCGYTLQTNFAAAFRKKFGCTPNKYRRQAGLASQVSQEKSAEMVAKAVAIINASLRNHHTSESLSNIIGVSSDRLSTAFKIQVGMGVYPYVRLKRMEKAMDLSKKGQTVNQIYPQIGYKNASCLYIAFKQTYRKTFGTWKEEMVREGLKNRHPAMQIDHAIQYDFLSP